MPIYLPVQNNMGTRIDAETSFKRLSHLTGSEQQMEVGQWLLKTGNIRYMSVRFPACPLDDR